MEEFISDVKNLATTLEFNEEAQIMAIKSNMPRDVCGRQNDSGRQTNNNNSGTNGNSGNGKNFNNRNQSRSSNNSNSSFGNKGQNSGNFGGNQRNRNRGRFNTSPNVRRPRVTSKTIDKDKGRCLYCNEFGHFIRECPKKIEDKKFRRFSKMDTDYNQDGQYSDYYDTCIYTDDNNDEEFATLNS